ncbi:cytidyltransferase-like protein [Lipingzhangella halophila]|uniref:Cytidyltransferase-like protein n=1 Tax=Lipingzhangella halophila TaxID=1783352 RepID=A0A7W7RJT1_9ACTN|nr:adenylyltransferase/cytidyltransferase family protein [Lipingzhangella halophila]MBB4933231.1 cytidyltransferase-like protein [Lipingzhangella halophila]
MTSPDRERTRAGGLTSRWYSAPPTASSPVVVTGVFDVLHVGHVRFLTQVSERGLPVVLGVEDDERITAWKGPDRPVNPADERAEVLSALRTTHAVFVISGPPEVAEWDAYAELLRPLAPAALAFTAGDPFTEAKRRGAEALGAEAWELPLTPGRSTTAALGRLTTSL